MQDLQSRGRGNERRIPYSILSRVFNPSQETMSRGTKKKSKRKKKCSIKKRGCSISSFDNEGVTTNRFCIINYKKQLTCELQAGMAEYGNINFSVPIH